jgi:Mu transposase, C-terminal domain
LEKGKVEAGVRVAERWILARLRHETFFALATLTGRIRELLADLNGRVMRQYQASRRELFERLDRPALRPLPAEPFVYSEWKTARVNIDYHVELHRHDSSVPFALVHEVVDTRLTATRSSASTRASGLRRMPATTRPAATRPTPRTCPRRTNITWSGPRRA